MIFDKESPIVQAWVRQIRNNTYKREDVPSIGNLQEIVYEILDNKNNQ